MKLTSKVTLRGSKTKGWIINITDSAGYNEDIAITHEEAQTLKELLNNKI